MIYALITDLASHAVDYVKWGFFSSGFEIMVSVYKKEGGIVENS